MRSSTNWRTGRRARGALAGATAVGALALAAGAARAADCGDLAGKTYGEATILAATTVSPPSSLMGLDPPAPVAIHAPFDGFISVTESPASFVTQRWPPPMARPVGSSNSLALERRGLDARAIGGAAQPGRTICAGTADGSGSPERDG